MTVSPEDRKKLKAEFPLVMLSGGDMDELAAAAGVPVTLAHAAMSDPDTLAEFVSAHRTAEQDGTLLKPVARRVSLAMLRRLEEALEAGDLDLTDISNLLPKVHKVVEHADRMEAARTGDYDGLPVVHITYVNGSTRINVTPPADVIDVDMPEVAP